VPDQASFAVNTVKSATDLVLIDAKEASFPKFLTFPPANESRRPRLNKSWQGLAYPCADLTTLAAKEALPVA
jgi:hypothetical protein